MFYMDTTPYSGLFMLAAIMEVRTKPARLQSPKPNPIFQIPTFHLKLSTLWPAKFRNDAIFLFTFFLTRLLFHAYMITSCVLPPTSLPMLSAFGIGNAKHLLHTPLPGWLNALAFPLHLSWFVGALRGYMRRRTGKGKSVTGGKAVVPPPPTEEICP